MGAHTRIHTHIEMLAILMESKFMNTRFSQEKYVYYTVRTLAVLCGTIQLKSNGKDAKDDATTPQEKETKENKQMHDSKE